MYAQGVQVQLPSITETDKYDIENFAAKYNVDIVSASFTRTAKNILDIKKISRNVSRGIKYEKTTVLH